MIVVQAPRWLISARQFSPFYIESLKLHLSFIIRECMNESKCHASTQRWPPVLAGAAGRLRESADEGRKTGACCRVSSLMWWWPSVFSSFWSFSNFFHIFLAKMLFSHSTFITRTFLACLLFFLMCFLIFFRKEKFHHTTSTHVYFTEILLWLIKWCLAAARDFTSRLVT